MPRRSAAAADARRVSDPLSARRPPEAPDTLSDDFVNRLDTGWKVRALVLRPLQTLRTSAPRLVSALRNPKRTAYWRDCFSSFAFQNATPFWRCYVSPVQVRRKLLGVFGPFKGFCSRGKALGGLTFRPSSDGMCGFLDRASLDEPTPAASDRVTRRLSTSSPRTSRPK